MISNVPVNGVATAHAKMEDWSILVSLPCFSLQSEEYHILKRHRRQHSVTIYKIKLAIGGLKILNGIFN